MYTENKEANVVIQKELSAIEKIKWVEEELEWLVVVVKLRLSNRKFLYRIMSFHDGLGLEKILHVILD